VKSEAHIPKAVDDNFDDNLGNTLNGRGQYISAELNPELPANQYFTGRPGTRRKISLADF
jgi:hypothetical protein